MTRPSVFDIIGGSGHPYLVLIFCLLGSLPYTPYRPSVPETISFVVDDRMIERFLLGE